MLFRSKRDIAKNHVKFYTLNGDAIGQKLGLGTRINMVMQAAFFALAKIIPVEDAVKYLKDSIIKNYGKKGQKVIDMNNGAVDAGIKEFHEVNYPASWADAKDEVAEGRPVPEYFAKVAAPMLGQVGDDLKVSDFVGREDGTMPSGTAKFEKAGPALHVPAWDAEKCVGCMQCSFVCPHATIRPVLTTAEELAAAPEGFKAAPKAKSGKEYNVTIVVDQLDCLECGSCVNVCPAKALTMVPNDDKERAKMDFWYYAQDKVTPKVNPQNKKTVIGSQFEQPLLEFSGACAGCGETPYVKLLTQLFGDRMMIANATGCSSIWGGTASISPYTTNKESGHGPAWINSLFEDNAEHGLGMQIGYETVRANLITKVEALKGKNADLDAAIDNFLATKNNTKANDAPAKALVAALEADGSAEAAEILKDKQYLAKKSFWIFGGDGWAYDIGYGGLDHVLASGHDVNVMVFDTEMYSNTGGQASKASNIGEVCQFAAAGKEISKKSLAEICMTYGYIYVAQIALGANMAQAVKVIAEAEAYPGPSLIIGYAPCELHGVKGGMTNCQNEMKKAVAAGYWNLFSFNPAAKAEGKNPFTLTSKAGDMSKYQEFLANETRYSRLARAFPDRAKELFEKNQEVADARYTHLTKLVELYK